MSDDQKFVIETLKRIQSDLSELKKMREGFASMESHMGGMIGDVFSHQRRILNIEDDLLRLKSHMDADQPDQ